MANYVDSTLQDDEQVIHRGYISLWSLLPHFVIGFLLIFFYLIGFLIIAYAIIQYKTTELAITNKRIIAKFGWISRSTIELNVNKVESIQVQQTILGRIFNFGTLIISGAGNPQAPIPNISNPMEFRRVFMEIQK